MWFVQKNVWQLKKNKNDGPPLNLHRKINKYKSEILYLQLKKKNFFFSVMVSGDC